MTHNSHPYLNLKLAVVHPCPLINISSYFYDIYIKISGIISGAVHILTFLGESFPINIKSQKYFNSKRKQGIFKQKKNLFVRLLST